MPSSRRTAWIAFAASLAMLAWPYGVVLRALVHQWLTDPEMGHALLAPVVILALLLRRRGRLAGIAPRASWWGVAPLLFGTAGYTIAVWGGGLLIATLAGVATLCAVVLLTLGRAALRVMAAPLSLGLFALPRFSLLYDPLTNPLQQVSATLAAGSLHLLGVDVTHTAGIVTVAGYPVILAESCSGLRFLIPLLFLAALLLQLRPTTWTAAIGVMAACVPLAVLVNAIRVAFLVYLAGTHQGVPPESVHTWLGYPLYALALAILFWLATHAMPIAPRREAV